MPFATAPQTTPFRRSDPSRLGRTRSCGYSPVIWLPAWAFPRLPILTTALQPAKRAAAN